MEFVKGLIQNSKGNIMKIMNAISEWVTNDFLKWEASLGRRGSISEYAAARGVSQGLISQIMNGSKTAISYRTSLKLAELSGDYSVMDVSGYARPDGSSPGDFASLDGLPPELKAALSAAMEKIDQELKIRGITDLSSKEAMEIATSILSEAVRMERDKPG